MLYLKRETVEEIIDEYIELYYVGTFKDHYIVRANYANPTCTVDLYFPYEYNPYYTIQAEIKSKVSRADIEGIRKLVDNIEEDIRKKDEWGDTGWSLD